MKLKLTVENRLGLSNEVLSLLTKYGANIKFIEASSDIIVIETYEIEKHLERNLASELMKTQGVKWVESILNLPSLEQNLFLKSIINSINEPLVTINNKGIINYQNSKAKLFFKLKNNCSIKDIFTQASWASKIDAAASLNISVNIQTISGPMLVDVNAINSDNNKSNGAVLVFHHLKDIFIRSFVSQNTHFISLKEIMTKSPIMQDVINRANSLSKTDTPVILYGESGVGKKTLAQALHQSSSRKNHIFSHFDCSSNDAIETENKLFGTTNLESEKPGLFEISNKGTVYLESIQNLSNECQMKLLRLLEKKWFYHVNGTNKKLADIKIIASSPLPLKHYVKTNQFNPELYYALDITHLNIPALRQRKEDIEILANQFLTQISLNDKHKCKILSSEALEKITSYNWPHNLNQLKNQLYKASKSSQDNIIESNDIIIDDYIPLERSIAKASLPDAVADFEKQFLKQWYKKHTSTRKLASVLGVSHTTIAQKLNKYGIN